MGFVYTQRKEDPVRILVIYALVMSLVLPASAAYYAIDKGSIQLGGTIGFESRGGDLYEDADEESQTQISFEPFVGYFLIPNLSLGTHVTYTSFTHGEYKNSAFGIGPVATYYLGSEYSTFFPFVSARFDYRKTSTEIDGNDSPDVTTTVIGFAGGITTMVSKNVGIRAMLFYEMNSQEVEDSDSVDGNKIGLRIGIESFIW